MNKQQLKNKTTTLNPTQMEQIQTQRFTESLNEILTDDHNPKVKFTNNLVQSAKVNIDKPLDNAQLNHLCYFADSWNQDLSIARSGAGLKIQFTLKNN